MLLPYIPRVPNFHAALQMDSEVKERDYDMKEAQRLQPPNIRMKAMTGAATFLTKFKNEWKKEFLWISSVSGNLRCNW